MAIRALFAAAFALLCGTAVPALAKDKGIDAAGQPSACLSALWQSGLFLQGPGTQIEQTDDACRYTGVTFKAGNERWSIAELILTGFDLMPAIAEQRPPHDLVVMANGVLPDPRTENSALHFAQTVDAVPFNFHLAYAWEDDEDILTLTNVGVMSALGSFNIDATITGLDAVPDSPFDAKAIAAARFSQVTLWLDNHGRIFQTMLAPRFAAVIPEDANAMTFIRSLADGALWMIDELPEGAADAQSRKALKTFAQSFPNPRGLYRLDIATPDPFGLADIGFSRAPAEIVSTLHNAVITARHDLPSTP